MRAGHMHPFSIKNTRFRDTRMDLQTLNVVILFISLIMAVSMFALHRAIPREDCLRDWGFAGMLHLVPPIMGLSILAGYTPPWALIACSNTAYIGGNTLILAGVRRHFGLRVRLDLLLAFLALAFALNWLPVVRSSFTLRLALLYAVLSVVSGLAVYTLLRHIAVGMRAAIFTLAAVQTLFVLQSLIRIPIFVVLDLRELSPMSSTFLRSSGCLATLLFLLLTNMACALIVARKQELGLSDAALRDPLTGWHNRRSLAQQAERRFARSIRLTVGFGIVTVDIDHFKKINDSFGHPVGDAAIRHLAMLSENALRPQDVLARLGGEEFCAVVDCDDEDGLFQIAERWRAAVEAAHLALPTQSLRMTVSLGYSLRAPGDRQWDDVLRRADTALYVAKNSGRNRVGRPVY
jgi:diguanylate cyclase (GGDEF)-like protein